MILQSLHVRRFISVCLQTMVTEGHNKIETTNDNHNICIDLEAIGCDAGVPEAWSIEKPKRSRAKLLPKLVVIGMGSNLLNMIRIL